MSQQYMNSLISIIIVNWNGKKWLGKCITSLQRQTYNNFEIILVDNNSTDGSIEYVKNKFPKVITIRSKKNLGRYFRILGQNQKVQGHLKIFTHKSLEEILIKEKFIIIKKYGVPFFFPFPISLIDRFFIRFISLSSGLLYICKR